MFCPYRPCLLRGGSAIAHHQTPKMVWRDAIFSTPKSGKIVHNYKCTPIIADLNILKVLFLAQQAVLKEKACHGIPD